MSIRARVHTCSRCTDIARREFGRSSLCRLSGFTGAPNIETKGFAIGYILGARKRPYGQIQAIRHSFPHPVQHSHIPLLLFFHQTQTIGATAAVMAMNALPTPMQSFLSACSPGQISQLTQVLQAAWSQWAETAFDPKSGVRTTMGVTADWKAMSSARNWDLNPGYPTRP